MFVRRHLSLGFLSLVLLAAALLAGCAKPPTEEIAKAEQAVAAAKQQQADVYVQEGFSKAEAALASAKDLVNQKKYKEAKEAAINAEKLAAEAGTQVEAAKEKMKAEAEQMLSANQTGIADLKTMIVKAIKKKAKINRDELQGLVGKWEIDMTDAQGKLAAGEVKAASDMIKAVQEQMAARSSELNAAVGEEPAKK